VIGFGLLACNAAFRLTAVGTNAADSLRKSRRTGAAEMVVGGAERAAGVEVEDEGLGGRGVWLGLELELSPLGRGGRRASW
jgi:hypothetical protein